MLAELFTLWLATNPLAMDAPVFRPNIREVSNWRLEAAGALEFALFDAAGLLVQVDPKGVSRCVRLNNYWCIKRAGWAGEIAADTDGHVAFSSAQEGALVAAVLLKRYYVDFKRHTAFEIVSRWAPAQCGGNPMAVRGAPRLAARGIGSTLRARWLAHRRGGGALKRSVVTDRPVPSLRAPTIAAGFGERQLSLPPISFSFLPGLATGGPITSCGTDSVRIANYARKASAGIAEEKADLKLFGLDGMPTGNLNILMLNMASVEIGPLKVREALVDAAVLALVERLKAAQATDMPSN